MTRDKQMILEEAIQNLKAVANKIRFANACHDIANKAEELAEELAEDIEQFRG